MADTNPIKKTDGERSELSRHGERDKVLVPSEIWGLLMILRAPLRRGSFYMRCVSIASAMRLAADRGRP